MSPEKHNKNRTKKTPLRLLTLFVAGLPLLGCASPDVVPLLGEDPEVQLLLGATPPADPTSSAVAAARRLHQALVQRDTETVWKLLAEDTRKALDDRGAEISASGRELIDESNLPGPNGTVRKVRFETIFFGPRLTDLEEIPGETAENGRVVRKVRAISEDVGDTELVFVREGDTWRLLRKGF